MANWFREDDTLALKTPNQREFISSEPCVWLLTQYGLFKASSQFYDAKQIQDNINHALDLIHERDTGTTSQATSSWAGPRLV